jgi:tetratricopeptide (TPR) repeat protein
MPRSASKRVSSQWSMSFIFAVVCCACLLLAVIAVFQSYRELRREVEEDRAGKQSSSHSMQENQSGVSAQSLKDEFDNLKDRTDNLQKLITTLIALSSLYAIVLTITGYLNVQKILQEAEASLEDAVETKDTLGREYGSLTHISANLEKVTKELREHLPDVQDPEIADRLSGAFITLARFYRGLYLSKKRLEKKKQQEAEVSVHTAVPSRGSRDESSAQILSLRERALFYARQALLQSPRSFSALNEVGNCLLEFGGTDAANEALKQFRESLIRNRDQQKARFSMSSILHLRGEYEKAEDLLTQALALELWETTKEAARRSDLHYNRACAYSKLAEKCTLDSEEMNSRLDQAFADLKVANVNRSEVSRDIFLTDIKPGGDLSLLASNQRYAELVLKLF